MEIHTFATIEAPATRIWDVLADFESYDRWNPMIRGVRGRAEEGARIRFQIRLGRGVGAPVTAEVVAARRGRSLRWIGPAGKWSRRVVSGEHYFELTEISPTRTRLEHGEDFRGLLMPARSTRVEALMRPIYDRFNQALAREVEARAQRS